MNLWLQIAQVAAGDPEVDTPLKKALWYFVLPVGLLVLIFGGGLMMKRAEQRAKSEREKTTS